MEDLTEMLQLLMKVQGKFALFVHCIAMAQEAQEEFEASIVEYNEGRERFLIVHDLEEYLKKPPEA